MALILCGHPASAVDMCHFVVTLELKGKRKGSIADRITVVLLRTGTESKWLLIIFRSLGGRLAPVVRLVERGITEEARAFLYFFNGEAEKMELMSEAQRPGFAPSTYTCPYHVWKPRGVLRSCTCSPTPAHQVKWETKLLDDGEGVVGRHAGIQADSVPDRGFFSAIDRRSMAIFCRSSGETLVSALRIARKGLAGRFLRACEVVRSK